MGCCGNCECESEDGMYKQHNSTGRCIFIIIFVVFIVLVGVGIGVIAKFVPPYIDRMQLEEYKNLGDDVGDNGFVNLTLSSCTNFASLNGTYGGQYVWQCTDRKCITPDMRCNGYFNCEDGSDEESCDRFCDEAVKRKLRWKCTNSQDPYNATFGPANPVCFSNMFICDGWVDCPLDTYNDEDRCPDEKVQFISGALPNKIVSCSTENNFVCAGRQHCVKSSVVCDGVYDCVDLSDEAVCN